MKLAAILVFTAVGAMMMTEVLRSIIHARRKSKDGLGGTQDIAMWGTIISIALLIAAAVSVIMSLLD
ncbi:hypothetical protein AB1L42_22840 [Thalassoglobus sp. JC818]|uniref:hypothetical protein n=1 Tax=Thalassoglobus sp. JC818 TaxID=3232136 RepID=UPI0034589F91